MGRGAYGVDVPAIEFVRVTGKKQPGLVLYQIRVLGGGEVLGCALVTELGVDCIEALSRSLAEGTI